MGKENNFFLDLMKMILINIILKRLTQGVEMTYEHTKKDEQRNIQKDEQNITPRMVNTGRDGPIRTQKYEHVGILRKVNTER